MLPSAPTTNDSLTSTNPSNALFIPDEQRSPPMVDVSPQNQDGSRWLNCLIEGESNVLPVIVGINKEVIYLQDAIRSSAARSLKDVDAYNLELWKVNIDIKTHDLSNLKLQGEKLESWRTILHYWPDQPHEDHLHIIVKDLAGDWE